MRQMYMFNSNTDLDTLDHETECTWLVLGVGKPQVRLLLEAERVTEVEAHDSMMRLSRDEIDAWDLFAPDKRWILRVEACTEYDLVDVIQTDELARVLSYIEAKVEVAAEPVTMVEAAE